MDEKQILKQVKANVLPDDRIAIAVRYEHYDRENAGGFQGRIYRGIFENVICEIATRHSYGVDDEENNPLNILLSIMEQNGDGCDFISKMILTIRASKRKPGGVRIVLIDEEEEKFDDGGW